MNARTNVAFSKTTVLKIIPLTAAELIFALLYGGASGAANDISPFIISFTFLGAIYFLVPTIGKFLKEIQLSDTAWRIISLSTIGGLAFFLVGNFATPAQALFYQNAENFFAVNFPAAGIGIPLIFNALRAIFLVYIAVSLLRVINMVRQDEDWQVVAKTPMTVAMIVGFGDILVDMVIL